MKRVFLSLTILLSCLWTYAQDSPHVDGELIVITDGTHPSETLVLPIWITTGSLQQVTC